MHRFTLSWWFCIGYYCAPAIDENTEMIVLQMHTPQLLNDFSFYRRTFPRMVATCEEDIMWAFFVNLLLFCCCNSPIHVETIGFAFSHRVRDVEANKIAMFMAHQVPMINCLCEVFQKRFQKVRTLSIWNVNLGSRSLCSLVTDMCDLVVCTESRSDHASCPHGQHSMPRHYAKVCVSFIQYIEPSRALIKTVKRVDLTTSCMIHFLVQMKLCGFWTKVHLLFFVIVLEFQDKQLNN